MLLILVMGLIFFISLYCFYQVSKYKIIDDYPGPTPLELLKFVLLPKSTVDSYKFFVSLNNKYGPVVKIWIKPFKPTLLVSDEKFIKHILLSKEHVNKASLFELLEAFIGNGLPIMSDINLWRQERKTISHVFNNQFNIDYISTIKTHAIKLRDAINENLNQPVDLQMLLLRHGLNIVYEILLNEDISNQDDRVNRYSTALKTFFEVYFDRINSPLKMNDNIFKLTNNYKIWNKCSEEATEFIESTLKTVVELKNKSPNESFRKDFIDLLLESGLSYDRILAHLRTFVVAGSDTVSAATGFALYELAKQPELQEKIFQEYISIVGFDEKVFAEFRDIQQMSFADCVMKESLRLYPPVPFIFRTLIKPAEIDDKVLPGDIDVTFSIIGSHYLNFEDPTKFKPERFLPENSTKIPANAYLPFSLGPRDCIGKIVAVAEVKFLISYIVRHFTLHPINDHKADIAGEVVLTSKNGLPVIFKRRIIE
ncbi:cytochrome P450 4c21-like isoform X2 [Onthophagus taurus]|uniref:cytochrome P450 4c21-like isoform X2 n=1 Tax=Onthophagus taurus TaxID=166361 RepID=UPI0039BE3403